jgi:hypothetical protein
MVDRAYFELEDLLREGRMHHLRITYRRIELFFQRHPWLELTGQVLLLSSLLVLLCAFLASLPPSGSR